jgi:hypothetical protein
MPKNSVVFLLAAFFVFFSCNQTDKFPFRLSEKTVTGEVILNQPVFTHVSAFHVDSVQKNDFGKALNELLTCKQFYENRNDEFDLAKLKILWNNLESESANFNFENVRDWIEITGFLLEITGNELYASELEHVLNESQSRFSETELKQIEKLLVPWIFTKNVDHIHVNIFANATIKYSHSLKGEVEITQETNYPESGKIQIRFKMEKKRFIELFIRIPEWAEGATVTEKGVKYVATHGQYSLVARNWNEGDFVEINLPIEQMPKL